MNNAALLDLEDEDFDGLIDAAMEEIERRKVVRAAVPAVEGTEFVCADFAQIESRVIAWLAGQTDILEVFASGRDVYVYTANRIGSDNRQLGKVCVLGLGFGMGWEKFIATALLMGGLVLTEDFARATVKNWREANDKIVRFWYDLDDAFRKAIVSAPGTRVPVGKVVIERGEDAIGILLPSGKRRLIYRNPRLEPDPSNRVNGTSIVYDGIQQYSKQWGPVRTYGGKLAENITQAVARDVMAHVMLLLDGMKVDLRLTVHDEIIAVASAAKAAATLTLVLETMRTPPPWAHDLPVGAEGWHGKRYRK
jgi:DNA polymerase bacteriophage-type